MIFRCKNLLQKNNFRMKQINISVSSCINSRKQLISIATLMFTFHSTSFKLQWKKKQLFKNEKKD